MSRRISVLSSATSTRRRRVAVPRHPGVASVVGQVLSGHLALLSQIAGVFIIIMGLHFVGAFKIGFLHREARYHHHAQPARQNAERPYRVGQGKTGHAEFWHRR